MARLTHKINKRPPRVGKKKLAAQQKAAADRAAKLAAFKAAQLRGDFDDDDDDDEAEDDQDEDVEMSDAPDYDGSSDHDEDDEELGPRDPASQRDDQQDDNPPQDNNSETTHGLDDEELDQKDPASQGDDQQDDNPPQDNDNTNGSYSEEANQTIDLSNSGNQTTVMNDAEEDEDDDDTLSVTEEEDEFYAEDAEEDDNISTAEENDKSDDEELDPRDPASQEDYQNDNNPPQDNNSTDGYVPGEANKTIAIPFSSNPTTVASDTEDAEEDDDNLSVAEEEDESEAEEPDQRDPAGQGDVPSSPRRSASPKNPSVSSSLAREASLEHSFFFPSTPPSASSEFAAAPAEYSDDFSDEEQSGIPTPVTPTDIRSPVGRSFQAEREISADSQAEADAEYEQSYIWYWLPPVARADSPRGKKWDSPERQLRKRRGDSMDNVGRARKSYRKTPAPRATRPATAAAPSDEVLDAEAEAQSAAGGEQMDCDLGEAAEEVDEGRVDCRADEAAVHDDKMVPDVTMSDPAVEAVLEILGRTGEVDVAEGYFVPADVLASPCDATPDRSQYARTSMSPARWISRSPTPMSAVSPSFRWAPYSRHPSWTTYDRSHGYDKDGLLRGLNPWHIGDFIASRREGPVLPSLAQASTPESMSDTSNDEPDTRGAAAVGVGCAVQEEPLGEQGAQEAEPPLDAHRPASPAPSSGKAPREHGKGRTAAKGGKLAKARVGGTRASIRLAGKRGDSAQRRIPETAEEDTESEVTEWELREREERVRNWGERRRGGAEVEEPGSSPLLLPTPSFMASILRAVGGGDD
ncbi:hypothetical protein BZA05DRAFT_465319 [Tricharina praecox]|uniref:uncharacterized protein n=1 Tax=Tricharina praecox TaxID=43433 RepID=UPI00221FBCBB|nr:uncharacterized protein BZA05DRAFT_465319 [Tricharina praecox]KAI5856121.1 hypothetical protein BZA05DRAFT_465319 [Tricharina praecox]